MEIDVEIVKGEKQMEWKDSNCNVLLPVLLLYMRGCYVLS